MIVSEDIYVMPLTQNKFKCEQKTVKGEKNNG